MEVNKSLSFTKLLDWPSTSSHLRFFYLRLPGLSQAISRLQGQGHSPDERSRSAVGPTCSFLLPCETNDLTLLLPCCRKPRLLKLKCCPNTDFLFSVTCIVRPYIAFEVYKLTTTDRLIWPTCLLSLTRAARTKCCPKRTLRPCGESTSLPRTRLPRETTSSGDKSIKIYD